MRINKWINIVTSAKIKPYTLWGTNRIAFNSLKYSVLPTNEMRFKPEYIVPSIKSTSQLFCYQDWYSRKALFEVYFKICFPESFQLKKSKSKVSRFPGHFFFSINLLQAAGNNDLKTLYFLCLGFTIYFPSNNLHSKKYQ